MVSITRRGPVCLAFDEVVRDRDAGVLAVAGYDVLAADERGLGSVSYVNDVRAREKCITVP